MGGFVTLYFCKQHHTDLAITAYYNAGSAALVLVLIALAIGLFLFCRRKRGAGKLKIGSSEEAIPLSRNINGHTENGSLKGKGRAPEAEPIFDVGDGSEDESEYRDRRD